MQRARAIIIAVTLLPALLSHAPAGAQGQPRDEWAGTYEYTASLGRTAGGTGIVVTYTIEVTPGNSEPGAVVEASGYMTDDKLRCETRTQGNRTDFRFHSYPDGGTANAYGVELYKKGDLLLSLEKVVQQKRTRYRVIWAKYNTDFKKRVFFRKTA
jgi:hypothetical protein